MPSRITGDKAFSARLQRMSGAEKVELVGQALFVVGDEIKVFAKQSITQGAVSGASHVPSNPGEPPKADTHILDTSIEVQQVAPLRVQVIAEAPYAAALEFGTSRGLQERPFMRPAAKAKRKRAVELVGNALTIVTRRG